MAVVHPLPEALAVEGVAALQSYHLPVGRLVEADRAHSLRLVFLHELALENRSLDLLVDLEDVKRSIDVLLRLLVVLSVSPPPEAVEEEEPHDEELEGSSDHQNDDGVSVLVV